MSHNMKGTGGMYGLLEVTRLGAALEYSAEQADKEALTAQLNELQDYLGRVQLFAKG
jgi:hypothetical protein